MKYFGLFGGIPTPGKKILTFAFLAFLFQPIFAQKQLPKETNVPETLIQNCPSDELREKLIQKNPAYAKKFEAENKAYAQKVMKQANSGTNNKSSAGLYTLPVVFHIIHSGEVVGAYNNHSESYIVAKVAAINEAMRGTQTSSPPTYPNVSDYGVDPEIELCLAHEDPNGNYTNGIVRYYAPDIAGVDVYPSFEPTMAWDTDKYVNIIINTTLSVTAYYTGGYDVIVGRPGIGAMAHELGHYLSLAHTFAGCTNNNCLLDGDRVCDTPPSSAPTYDAVANTCTTDADDTSTNNPFRPTSMGGLGDVDDMLGNMMDYGSPGALFSAGQATKMRNNIEVNRMNLVNNNTVCSKIPASSNDAGVYYVSTYHDLQCSNNAELIVHFTNFGSTTLTSVEFEVVANNVVLNTVSWTGNLSSGATTHQAISSGDIPIGNTTVTVRTKLPNGSTDGNVSNDGATIDFNLQNSDECQSYSGCQSMSAATAGGPGNTTILNISEAFPSVALIYGEVCIDAFGDIYSPNEAFNIYDEDGTLRGVTLNAAGDCARSEQFCFNMTNANYSNWIQDGAITFTFDPITTAVDPVFCSTLNEICATVNIGYDYPCTGAGSPCSDNDACTINDSYDANCNCIGTFLDGDGDGVCDNEDICPGVGDATIHTLYLQLDWFSQETSWELKEGNTIIQSASYTTDNRRDYFEEQFCLAPGCYDFVISDSYCDGIVRGADGFFTIEDPNGNVLGAGSNFGCNQTVSFCIVENACDGYAVNNFSPDPLSHSGTGSKSSTVNFSELRENVDFDITGINNVTSGNANKKYTEQVTVSYIDINSNTIRYGVFVNVSSVNVAINEPIQGITVSLTDALDGDAGSLMQIDMSSVTSCPSSQSPGCTAGTFCNDNNACTTNDVYDSNCNCAGTFADADGDGVCDANDICAGGDDNIDTDGDGTPDFCDNCSFAAGTSCNDNNACTTNDVYDSNCNCAGTFTDADGDGVCDANDICAGGDDNIDTDGDGTPDFCDNCSFAAGTSCNDNNVCTTNDVYDTNCNCAGTFADADGDGVCDANDICPGGNDNIDTDGDGTPDFCDDCSIAAGTSCNDNNVCTTNDVYDSNCNCAGTFADADGDGVCDANDICPGGDDNIDTDGDGTPDFCDNSTSSGCNECSTVINNFPHTEDFESGLSVCQLSSDDFNWAVLSGSTTSSATGPTAAHEGSTYFYMESSSPNNPSKTAGFQGACYDLSSASSASIDFWYHMYGATMGTLTLEISTDNGVSWTTAWTLAGDQGNSWFNVNIDLSAYTGNVITYRFVGVTSSSYTSDFALDQITVDTGSSACTVGGSCNDNNVCTTNDVYDTNCNCAGAFADADGDGVCDANDICPGGNDNIDTDGDGTPDFCDDCSITAGTSCNDNNVCTTNDVYDSNCNCAGTFADADGDGVCDANDICPGGDDNIDTDGDGTPDFCDNGTSPECNDCSTVISNFPHTEDFESGLSVCQLSSDDFNWAVLSGSTTSSGTGPSTAYEGSRYFYMESSSPNNPSKTAGFQGACYDLSSASSASIDFWYHMYGATMGTLTLEISTDNGVSWTTAWTLAGDQGNSWFNVNIDLSAYIGNVITYRFVGVTSSSYTSDFALDQITVDTGSSACTVGGSCNDNNVCTTNDVYDTNCNCAGTFADADGDGVCDANDICPGGNDNIDTDGDGTPDFCDDCSITAGTSCNDNNVCTTNDVYDANCNCAGTFADADGDGVCDANDICPGGDDNIDTDGDGTPDFCDNSTSSGCNDCSTVINNFPHTENFESGLSVCQLSSDDFDWTVFSGSTSSSGTGPSAAYEGSRYFYMESSSPNNPSKTAGFQGACYDLSSASGASIDFWYHMYGATMGRLTLEISKDNGVSWTTAWTLAGDQGNSWSNVNVDLSAFAGNVITYRFVGVTSSSFTSDFALDQITVDTGSSACRVGASCNDNNACTTNDVYDSNCNCAGTFADSDGDGVCDANDICAGGDDTIDTDNDGIPDACQSCASCSEVISTFPHVESFESSTDNICQLTDDDFDWARNTGSTGSSNTGPSSAIDGSYYVYCEASTPNNPSKTAGFQGACYDLSQTTNAYISFWYHMYGANMGSLKLEISDDMGASWNTVWQMSQDQGNNWYNANVDISSFAGNIMTYRFTGTTDNGFESDIALDNISVVEADSCLPGGNCDDNDPCTTGETYDSSCNCTGGQVVDQDNDGYCIAEDADDSDPCVPDSSNAGCLSSVGCSTYDLNDFEGSLGIWNDGGSDAGLSNKNAYSGSKSMFLRDNSGFPSAIYTDDLAMASYDEIVVSFTYVTKSMESGEDFLLEFSNDSGSSFETIQSWISGIDFQNGQRQFVTVSITGKTFNDQVVLRLRCDASNNADQVYLDDVQIEGCNGISDAPQGVITRTRKNTEEDKSKLFVFPNPLVGDLNVRFVRTEVTKDLPVHIEILTSFGQKIIDITETEVKEIYTVNTSQLASGQMYICKLTTPEGKSYVRRFMKI